MRERAKVRACCVLEAFCDNIWLSGSTPGFASEQYSCFCHMAMSRWFGGQLGGGHGTPKIEVINNIDC